MLASDLGAVVLDAWGALHPYSTTGPTPTVSGTTSWPGWDIARGLTVATNNTGGYVLDGWGGLHPFGYASVPSPPTPTLSAYWSGWDIARAVAMLPNNMGGYMLDGWGGLHPFGVGGNAGTTGSRYARVLAGIGHRPLCHRAPGRLRWVRARRTGRPASLRHRRASTAGAGNRRRLLDRRLRAERSRHAVTGA
jgi:hypothetical protein